MSLDMLIETPATSSQDTRRRIARRQRSQPLFSQALFSQPVFSQPVFSQAMNFKAKTFHSINLRSIILRSGTLKTQTPYRIALCSLALCGLGAFAVQARAQSMTTSASSYETGYGMVRNQMQTAIDPSTRDANGNRVLLDGMMITGTDNSVYAYAKTMGAGDVYSGAGALGGATAIGNNLQVTVNGNYNTVVVHSTQTNSGAVTATVNGTTATGATGTVTSDQSLNGQVNLNGF